MSKKMEYVNARYYIAADKDSHGEVKLFQGLPFRHNCEGIEYVAVSDAIIHIERLVFPAFPVDGGYAFTRENIAGKHTMMIEGGNPRSVYDDEVYLRYLCRLNGMSWEGLEKPKKMNMKNLFGEQKLFARPAGG